jgi:hypothetical protein
MYPVVDFFVARSKAASKLALAALAASVYLAWATEYALSTFPVGVPYSWTLAADEAELKLAEAAERAEL